MSLHLDTLAVVSVIISVELTLVLVFLGWLLRGEAGVGPWALGMSSFSAASLVMALRAWLPDMISILGEVGLIYIGIAFAWVGARDSYRRPRKMKVVWFGLAAVLLGGWLAEKWSNPGTATVCLSIAMIGWSAGIAWTFLRYAPAAQKAGARFGASIFLAQGFFHLARFGILPESEATKQTFLFLAANLFSVAWVLAVFAMMSHRFLTELRGAARTDGLTGLLNRLALREDGARAMQLCKRAGIPCAVLLIDLDDFKRLNDTYGHSAGDAALQHFANVATSVLGKGNLVGRYGGEEFCVIMPGATEERAMRKAEKLRTTLEGSPVAFKDQLLPFTASVGLVWGNGLHINLPSFLTQADAALYQAKALGKNRVQGAESVRVYEHREQIARAGA